MLRIVEPVSAFAWYDDYRAYATGRLALGGRVALTAAAKVDRLAFANARTDTQASLDGAVDIEALRLLHVIVGGIFTTRDSSSGSPYVYHRSEAYLRLVLSY